MDHAAARQRLLIAFELHEAGVAMKAQQLRRQHPDWSEAEVNEALTAWLHERPGAPFGDVSGDVVVRALR